MASIIALRGSTPSIDPSVFLAPNAAVIGDVVMAADSSAFYGASIRGDSSSIRVGAGSNVQDNAVLHADPGFPTTVGRGVSIGHGAVVHGCTVGDDCLIGMSATVMNGAVVGSGSLVAAGAVVLEGTVIPPGSLVAGVPAKVRRAVTEAELAGIRVNAATYVALASDHRKAVAPPADGE